LFAKAGLSAGYQYRKGGQPAEALNCFQLVRTALEGCAQKAPLERESLLKLASAYEAIGSLQKVKQPNEAAVAAQRACELFEQFVVAEPNNAAHQHTLGSCLHLLGDAHRVRRQWEESARAFKRAADVRERLVQRCPGPLDYRNDAHWSWQVYGETLERLDQRDAAAAACRQAVSHLQELVRRAPQHEEYRRRLNQRGDNLIRLLQAMGRTDAADALHRDLQPTKRAQMEDRVGKVPR
jgi:tetratricopeptide (TPR) repeat protein